MTELTFRNAFAAGVSVVALGTVALLPSAADARPAAVGHKATAGASETLNVRYDWRGRYKGHRLFGRAQIRRSYVRTVRRGPWRITQRVIVVRSPFRGVTRRRVVELNRVWVGRRGLNPGYRRHRY